MEVAGYDALLEDALATRRREPMDAQEQESVEVLITVVKRGDLVEPVGLPLPTFSELDPFIRETATRCIVHTVLRRLRPLDLAQFSTRSVDRLRGCPA